MPAPLDSLGSYAKVSAAMVQVEGSAVSLGTATGAQDAIAHATPTLVSLGAIHSALAAVQTALSALSTPGAIAVATTGTAAAQTGFGVATGAAATQIAAAVTAITNAAASYASQAPLLPSNSATCD
jgi:hypothetical protein